MPNPTESVFLLSPALLEEGLQESRSSPRRRMLFPIHRGPSDLVQRMLNFLQPGTYIQPHLHPRPSASETLLVMSGLLGFITFDTAGQVLSTHHLSIGELIDIEAGVWHSVLALADDTIILEIKRGPYDAGDKIFADWAPAEGTDAASSYLDRLTNLPVSPPRAGQ